MGIVANVLLFTHVAGWIGMFGPVWLPGFPEGLVVISATTVMFTALIFAFVALIGSSETTKA